MAAWLPSLAPVKGFARYLYVAAHWQSISEDLKKRDERLQAVEDAGRQLLRLEREAHEAEMQSFARYVAKVIEKEVGKLEEHDKEVEEFKQRVEAMFNDFLDTIQALALVLYIERDSAFRDMIRNRVPAKAREILDQRLEVIRGALQSSSHEAQPDW